MLWLLWASLIFTFPQLSCGRRINYELTYERRILSPDGFAKSVITVNGLFPGPMLNGSVGDVMIINVINNLPFGEQLTVHWHGISQVNTSWSDGTAGITNCPIQSLTNYTYEFALTEAGTFWYHPHFLSLRTEGGYGFLIVEDVQPLATYDAELLIVLTEWYHQTAAFEDAGLQQYGPSSSTSGILTENSVTVLCVGDSS